ncbi:TlpA disulfide reductase family protein [Chryseobacterium sp.]|uniref:TlpA family protein disulfide reductase n=1 Tax=Chryseobacterium sp. TaxID=1871047 RepID=UPI0023EFE228|nr:TlpA disulfide reductase family protein [Chryseobacterium sp.]
MKNIFCRGILSLVFTFLAATTSLAQNKSVKVGESLPDNFWTTSFQVVNHPQKTLDFSKDRNKLILLDFWNTWCSACLKAFPKMEQLKEQFGDKVKIMAVSNQDRQTLEKFFASKNGQRFNNVVSVAGDQLFHPLFPHQGVPYVVWIKDGKLLSTTDGAQVNENTIREVLAGESSGLQTVIQMSRERPLMLSEDFDREKGLSMINYSLFAKGRIRGMGFGSGFRRSGNQIYGRQFTNLSLLEIFSTLADEIFQMHKESFSDKRRIVEVQNPIVLDYIKKADGSVEDSNLYSYEYIVPLSKADSLYPLMLKNISEYGDYKATIEKRTVRCLVLKRTSSINKLKTTGGLTRFSFSMTETTLKNASLYKLINNLNAIPTVSLPIVDDTGITGNVDLTMGAISDVSSIRRALSQYDLDLQEEEREIDMLIIKDKLKN